jgi:hypothetical protein
MLGSILAMKRMFLSVPVSRAGMRNLRSFGPAPSSVPECRSEKSIGK